jgi:TorA maturation chaperone TorD
MNAASQKVAFEAPRVLTPEDQGRADYYALLGHLMRAAPDDRLLNAIVVAPEPQAENGDAGLTAPWRALSAAAGVVTHEAVADEYDRLFGGVGRPAVMVFGSHFLGGFLHEKPLAALRDDLAALGLQRVETVSETEDHLAALCEVMRFLILGDLGSRPASLEQQKAFYSAHIEPWVLRCWEAIQASPEANFYKRVAAFGHAFFTVESEAFGME